MRYGVSLIVVLTTGSKRIEILKSRASALLFLYNKKTRGVSCHKLERINESAVAYGEDYSQKVVATANRCEGVYDQADEPSVPFAKKEER